MCGRITLTVSSDELAELFALYTRSGLASARYNIAPTQPIAAVLEERKTSRQSGEAAHDSGTPAEIPGRIAARRRSLEILSWGLIPPWSKDPRAGPLLINARAETVASKPAFRKAFRQRRCIIPASGFYEWDRKGAARARPFYMRPRHGPLFAFAGLWEQWSDPAGSGSEVRSCCVITVPSNPEIAIFHDRMPAILAPADFDAWLDSENTDAAACQKMLRTRAPEDVEIVPVSAYVNAVKNDGPKCVERAEPEALLF